MFLFIARWVARLEAKAQKIRDDTDAQCEAIRARGRADFEMIQHDPTFMAQRRRSFIDRTFGGTF